MNETLAVLLICLGLLAGTFVCGYAPSLINASPKIMNLVAIYGGGVIIGAAIVIILPEAATILINAQHELKGLNPQVYEHGHGHDHDRVDTMPAGQDNELIDHEMTAGIGTAILIGFVAMLLIDEATYACT